jgi:predicted N-acyltransferase
MGNGYHYRVVATIDAVDAAAWDRLHASADTNITLTRHYLRAVEQERLFGSAPLYITLASVDAPDLIAAAVCAIMPLDLVALADQRVQRLAEGVRRLAPAFLFTRAVVCGSLVTLGHSGILIHPDVDPASALSALHRVISAVARQARASLVLFQDIGPCDPSSLGWLRCHGYLCLPTLPTHRFPPTFRNFDEYTLEVRAGYRRAIRLSRRKLRDAGVTLERVEDPDDLIALYGEAEHRLYRAVEERAAYKFEVVSTHFFHALARAWPRGLTCTFARSPTGEVIGFLWSLLVAGRFHTLYIGLDYHWNARCDLYFNLFYADLDFALRRGAISIDLGQTAETFKSRLGAWPEPRYLCFQARRPMLALALHLALPLLAPESATAPVRHVFRHAVTR